MKAVKRGEAVPRREYAEKAVQLARKRQPVLAIRGFLLGLMAPIIFGFALAFWPVWVVEVLALVGVVWHIRMWVKAERAEVVNAELAASTPSGPVDVGTSEETGPFVRVADVWAIRGRPFLVVGILGGVIACLLLSGTPLRRQVAAGLVGLLASGGVLGFLEMFSRPEKALLDAKPLEPTVEVLPEHLAAPMRVDLPACIGWTILIVIAAGVALFPAAVAVTVGIALLARAGELRTAEERLRATAIVYLADSHLPRRTLWYRVASR